MLFMLFMSVNGIGRTDEVQKDTCKRFIHQNKKEDVWSAVALKSKKSFQS
jgi:hypothetical protein